MSVNNKISGMLFKEMISSAANWLNEKREDVDRLNVFPVPDGDTGTNMAMTIKSAAKFALERSTNETVGEIAQQMAYGALMGARGNSGVILSQILAGFSETLKNKTEIDAEDIIKAFSAGANAAYKAVSNPMEGTVLTVVREASEELFTLEGKNTSVENVLNHFLEAGYESLARTPELLPVLKQAGVVDAGGQGLLFIIEGFLSAVKGEPVFVHTKEINSMDDLNDSFNHFFSNPTEIIYPYCTEFLVKVENRDAQEVISTLRNTFDQYGDCLVVVGAENVVKVHIHTDNLGSVLGYASKFGELDDIKINNMREQNRALLSQGVHIEENLEHAIIAVANGEGIERILKSLGATYIVNGGQTMNPSTQDFLDALEELHAKDVIILPNNKNIIMAAEQAGKLCDQANVYVVSSRTIPEGLAALMSFNPDREIEDNIDEMTESMKNVLTGEITNAIRDTEIEGILIKKNQFMAILNGRIINSCNTLEEALDCLLERIVDDGYELVTLYHGLDRSSEKAKTDLKYLEQKYKDLEIELYEGGQLIYPYIISAE